VLQTGDAQVSQTGDPRVFQTGNSISFPSDDGDVTQLPTVSYDTGMKRTLVEKPVSDRHGESGETERLARAPSSGALQPDPGADTKRNDGSD
jgi:hypothetical protein